MFSYLFVWDFWSCLFLLKCFIEIDDLFNFYYNYYVGFVLNIFILKVSIKCIIQYFIKGGRISFQKVEILIVFIVLNVKFFFL